MASIFSLIASGQIPSRKVASDDRYYAFLDINPLKPGHTLVIPRREVDYIFDLDDDELAGLQLFAKRVARAIAKTVPCRKVAQAVIGLEVPHAHVHLVPIDKEGDLNFANEHAKLSDEEMDRIAAEIAANFE